MVTDADDQEVSLGGVLDEGAGRGRVVVLHADPRVVGAVADTAGAAWEIIGLRSWEDLFDLVRSTPVDLVAVDPYAVSGTRISEMLELFVREFPALEVVGVMEVSPSRMGDVLRLGQMGVTSLVDPTRDLQSLRSLRHKLESVMVSPLARLLLSSGSGLDLDAQERTLLAAAVKVVVKHGGVPDMAETLDVSDRTLLRWHAASRLPGPRELFTWIRILWAAALLDDGTRAILDVATTVGYASDSVLRRSFKIHMGVSPSRIREMGAWSVTLKSFRRVLRA